jgi:7,8-dihydropterin-6-yl-methyl-4-(beta-D-ribofuranosyl)aminobenzene 5'-phosphate synthase
MRITTIIENNSEKDNLHCELGLSILIEWEDKKILMDTGQSDKLMDNADKLGVDFEDVDSIVISHGHFDHTGGLIPILKSIENKPSIYLSNEYFNPKYKKVEGKEVLHIGSAFNEEDLISINGRYIQIDKDVFPLYDGVYLFSGFEKYNDFEKSSDKYIVKKDEKFIIDDFSNEIALAIDSEDGLVVFVGCSHIGLANILENIMKRTAKKIIGVIGGSHLSRSSILRINDTIDYLKSLDLRFIALSHCTGLKVMKIVEEEFGEKFIKNNAGTVFEILVPKGEKKL